MKVDLQLNKETKPTFLRQLSYWFSYNDWTVAVILIWFGFVYLFHGMSTIVAYLMLKSSL